MSAEMIHGDCLDALREITPRTVDAIITDPPYLSVSTGASRVSRANAIPDESQFFEHWLSAVWRLCEIVLKPTGALWMTIDWRGALAVERVALRSDLSFAAVGVWDKELIGMGHVMRRSYECFVIAKMPEWSRQDAGERDVWRVRWSSTHGESGHEAEKPVPLFQRAIELLTPPTGLVCDPFCGSGTTGVACVLSGRSFMGIEREATYVEIARRRIADAEAQGSLFADGAA